MAASSGDPIPQQLLGSRMHQDLNYENSCRAASTAQGLDPITDRLTADGIAYGVEQTGGFVMVVRIPLTEPAWIGVTASDRQASAWCVVLYNDDTDAGRPLSESSSYDWPADEAVAAIREHIVGVGQEPSRAARRLVNATVVYCYPNGSGGTYTVLGPGSWGRPKEALEYAQQRRDAFHRRHGATPLTEVPWHRDVSHGGLPLYRPPGVAVGIEIHDVRTHERWFIPTCGAPLGPVGPRDNAAGTPRWHHDLPASQGGVTAAQSPRQPASSPQHGASDLRSRLDTLRGDGTPNLCL